MFFAAFSRKPELYGVWRRVSALESPNASLHVHAFDRAWTVASEGFFLCKITEIIYFNASILYNMNKLQSDCGSLQSDICMCVST